MCLTGALRIAFALDLPLVLVNAFSLSWDLSARSLHLARCKMSRHGGDTPRGQPVSVAPSFKDPKMNRGLTMPFGPQVPRELVNLNSH
jgi:hypothetical protein